MSEQAAVYEISLSPNGRANKVVVNEQDITEQVLGLEIGAQAGMPSVVILHTQAYVRIAGVGIVTQRVHDPEAFATAVKAIDRKQLEERALAKQGWGSEGTLTDAYLDALGEILSENQS